MTAAPPTDEERLAWLRLARTPNVGPVAFDHLTNRFGSARAALDALPRLVQRGAVPQPPSADEVRRELEAGDRLGARLILSREPGFPSVDAPFSARADLRASGRLVGCCHLSGLLTHP